jgi:hypothetical protein
LDRIAKPRFWANSPFLEVQSIRVPSLNEAVSKSCLADCRNLSNLTIGAGSGFVALDISLLFLVCPFREKCQESPLSWIFVTKSDGNGGFGDVRADI